ncbi:MAG: hypothetical protein ACP6IU_08385, partial [Candidatus Asgardarchaeia archaeon]
LGISDDEAIEMISCRPLFIEAYFATPILNSFFREIKVSVAFFFQDFCDYAQKSQNARFSL